ncbi:MAG TPA: DUF2085 domain-containing protein [Ktedonobacterales bacterium]|nr:DUF2085 domain-containing protein [Ktedonobacterales bacterium]
MDTTLVQDEQAQGNNLQDRQGGPPPWLMIASAVALIGLAAVLVFWPGATLLDRLRALDGGICAQLPTHSFYPGGQRLPLCSRNTGIYLGYTLTFLFLFLSKRGRATEFPRWPMTIFLGLCILAMAVDGFNSLFLDLRLPHLYQPHNLLRLTTGLLTGMAMACFLLPVTNVTLWKFPENQRTIDSWWQILRLLPILALAFLAVGTQAAVFLYPVAILSTLGVMAALGMINITILVAATGRACNLTNVRQVVPYIAVAALLVTGELTGLFFLNHWLLHQLTAA